MSFYSFTSVFQGQKTTGGFQFRTGVNFSKIVARFSKLGVALFTHMRYNIEVWKSIKAIFQTIRERPHENGRKTRV
jgi:hypothetical protein